MPSVPPGRPSGCGPGAGRVAREGGLVEASAKPRAIIAVATGSHCLADLLHRRRSGALSIEIAGVVGNHGSLRALTEWHGIAFHHLPVTDANRAEQEAAIEAVMAATQADYLVLSRYMQVLSADMTARPAARCINIHHSFLPGFTGRSEEHPSELQSLLR